MLAPFYGDKMDLLRAIDEDGAARTVTTPAEWAVRLAYEPRD